MEPEKRARKQVILPVAKIKNAKETQSACFSFLFSNTSSASVDFGTSSYEFTRNWSGENSKPKTESRLQQTPKDLRNESGILTRPDVTHASLNPVP